jgi:hypothetical protein
MARHFFGRRPADDQGAKNLYEMTKGVLTIAICASLAFSVAAQAREHLGETSM